ncbi:serine/threonine protein kinase [Methylobacterium sp. J-078]|uniref:serine/threonine protein kinase n=1 Tax=Methylobacterium sp. J-078 TaxID=2836657 RepID=UPI001FBB849D|nr:serine/threonine protein kinase [Methylobacterium sp. J-078]MCJ2047453.1 serine/threonine protein kinase [Methylobacterium sp. J-078]
MHRDTILKPASVLGLALLVLTLPAGSLGTPVLAQTAPQARPQVQPSPGAAQPQGQGQGQGQQQGQPGQAQAPRTAAPAAGTGGGRGAAQVGRNRRPSYAACNRVSHARGLRGGARRRFLVRCKLGYDRPRTGQPQAAPTRQQ